MYHEVCQLQRSRLMTLQMLNRTLLIHQFELKVIAHQYLALNFSCITLPYQTTNCAENVLKEQIKYKE